MIRYIILTVLATLLCYSQIVSASKNLQFGGTLVTEPCNLDPNTSEIAIDFGTVVQKELYLHNRTVGKPFSINLIDCDISLGKLVTLTFRGEESHVLPGMLAVKGAANGITIGLESTDGKLLAVNHASPQLSLNNGFTHLDFDAFVKGEPDAITQKTITAGNFSSAATFEMNYD